MKTGHRLLFKMFFACLVTALSVFLVAAAVLLPAVKSTDTSPTASVEYSPADKATAFYLIECADCKSAALLSLDRGECSSCLTLFKEGYPDGYGVNISGRIKINRQVIADLADGAGGVNFYLYRDTDILPKGNWRLTGNQVYELLHAGDDSITERLLAEYFSSVFRLGLKNEQIYVILDSADSTDLSFSELYNIARYSESWICQTAILS